MAREFFKDYPDTTTPLSSERINGLLDGDEAMGNIVVDSIKSKNLFNFNNITTLVDGVGATNSINYTNKTITLTGYYHKTNQTLKELCPNMVADNTYTISFIESPSAVNNFIYLDGGGGIWNNGTSKTITQNDLNGKVNFYGGDEGTTNEYVMSNIMIEEGTVVTDYAPYQDLDIIHSSGNFTPIIFGNTTAGTATYNLQEGHYERIGKIVHFEIRIGCTLTSSSGLVLIGGLPILGEYFEPSAMNVVSTLQSLMGQPLCTRIYGNNLLLGTYELGNAENLNWSSTNYIYISGTMLLK